MIPRYPKRNRLEPTEHKPTPKHTKAKIKDIKAKGHKNTLEKEFLENFHKGRVAVSCGTKNSGKSFTALHYLQWCFDNDVYDMYFLCLPTFEHEQSDSYKFINEYKGKAKITIFSGWDEIVIEKIKAVSPAISKFCLVDDATGNFRLNASQEELMFIAQIRHFNCSMWLIFHMLRNALPSTYRSCIDYLFIHMNTNRKGLEAVYEEFLSLVFPKFNEFLEYYRKEILSVDYNSLLIFTREVGKYDSRVIDWDILKIKL